MQRSNKKPRKTIKNKLTTKDKNHKAPPKGPFSKRAL